jgi:RNA polymerase sigma-70 factor (ECF subfamily)
MEHVSFEDIFTTFQKPLYNFVLRMARDEKVAEDLTQETFIKVYQNLDKYRGDASLSTWIYKIATNTYLDYFRSADHNKKSITDFIDDDEVAWDSHDNEKIMSIDEQLVKSEMNECLQGFLNDLPEDYRSVVVLHDLQGLKNREIADVLNCTLDTVKIRLHRARKKFRVVLADNCNIYKDSKNRLSCVQKEDKCL